jgi:hypothetical protein
MPESPSLERFVRKLQTHCSPEQRETYLHYSKTGEDQYGEGDEFMGVRIEQVFRLAKEFTEMPCTGESRRTMNRVGRRSRANRADERSRM